ncbi:MAG: hypothetical protein AB2693_28245 [Candidatus Thiodiazotropha sp.]
MPKKHLGAMIKQWKLVWFWQSRSSDAILQGALKEKEVVDKKRGGKTVAKSGEG